MSHRKRLFNGGRVRLWLPLVVALAAPSLSVERSFAESVPEPDDSSHAIQSEAWRDSRPNRRTGGFIWLPTECGEPVFVWLRLLYTGAQRGPVGLDGPTLAEASLDVRVRADPKSGKPEKEWQLVGAWPAGPGEAKPVAMLPAPSGVVNCRTMCVAVWFSTEDTGGGGPRRVLFDRPGWYAIRARFPRLFLPHGSASAPQWSWQAGTQTIGVDIEAPAPQMKAFAADVAAVISADLIVPPEHRTMLEKHAAQQHRVAR